MRDVYVVLSIAALHKWSSRFFTHLPQTYNGREKGTYFFNATAAQSAIRRARQYVFLIAVALDKPSAVKM
jgi:hypothetical protein